MGERSHMGSFWDQRAHENALYFVDNTVDYRSPDAERFWARGDQTVDLILGRLGAALQPTDRVVEIGCGVGRLTRAIAARVHSVRALDVSTEMLAQARRLNPGLDNVKWVRGDGVSLSGIPDADADVCFSHVVFQHIPDPAITLAYVREMGRVLRPGGWSAFQVSNNPKVHRPQRNSQLRRRALALVGRAPRGQGDPAWLGSAVDLDEIRTAAEAVGLSVDRIEGQGTQFCLVLLRRPL